MLTTVSAFLLGVSLFPIISISAVILFVCLWCLTGDEVNHIYILWLILLGSFLFFRFQPSLWNVAFYALGSIAVGVLYSFYRWFRECRKLRKRLNDAFSGVTWPAKIVPNLSGCVFNTRWTGDNQHTYEFNTEESCLEAYTPRVENNRGALTEWIVFWFLYVLNDITFKLIRNLQDLCKGIYNRISAKCFSL